jgi:glutaconyl-CoA decarboxylase
MKKFLAKVNGKEYVVELTEIGSDNAVYTAPAVQPAVYAVQPAAPVAAPVIEPVKEAAVQAPVVKAAPAGSMGSVKIEAPMPGTILKVVVQVGQKVSKNETLCVLEAMKMENEIVAADAGVIASINIAKGDTVETGQLLISMN